MFLRKPARPLQVKREAAICITVQPPTQSTEPLLICQVFLSLPVNRDRDKHMQNQFPMELNRSIYYSQKWPKRRLVINPDICKSF
jgi:hypothetical protein